MGVFRRGSVWWYTFHFQGQRIQESSSSQSKNIAIRAERERRRQLEEGVNLLKPINRPSIFSVHPKRYFETNSAHWSKANIRIETYNLKHLTQEFGKLLLTDITGADVSKYQARRKTEAASSKTINMEIGTLRAILRKNRLWANLQPDVKMLRARTDVGRALTRDEEQRLLNACAKSRSRSLYPAVLLSIHTGLRNQELRLLRWNRVDLIDRVITVGKSKTAGGEGRTVPLSDTAWRCLVDWRSQWPSATPAHYVFPSERYSLAGEDGHKGGRIVSYKVRSDVPIGSWKIAWTNARTSAGVSARWHALRHTFVSRIAEGQVSDATIMALARHLSVKMKEKYSHVRQEAKRQAVAILDGLPLQ